MKAFYSNLIFLILLTTTVCSAQPSNPGSLNFGFDGILLFQTTTELNGVRGEPYYKTEPIEGMIITEDNKKFSSFIKYNIYFDRMEFSENSSFETAKKLPLDPDLLIQLDTEIFRYLDIKTNKGNKSGYFQILAMSHGRPAIIKKHLQIIIEPSLSSKSSYGLSKNLRKLRSFSEIYYIDNGKAFYIQNHQIKSLDSFPQKYQGQLKEFIKLKNLKFEDDYRALQELVKEYYRLKLV